MARSETEPRACGIASRSGGVALLSSINGPVAAEATQPEPDEISAENSRKITDLWGRARTVIHELLVDEVVQFHLQIRKPTALDELLTHRRESYLERGSQDHKFAAEQ